MKASFAIAATAALTVDSAAAVRSYRDIPDLTLIDVPAGNYTLGDKSAPPHFDQDPVHVSYLNDYSMSAYEITNAQFVEYLNSAYAEGALEYYIVQDSDEVYGGVTAGEGVVIASEGQDFAGERLLIIDGTASDDVVDPVNGCKLQYNEDLDQFEIMPEDPEFGAFDQWPIVYVTWFGATAFSSYYGLALPTEAQWETAARSGDPANGFATDDGTISPDNVNYNWTVNHIMPVGSYPANPWGFYDMSGNAFEHVADWYGPYDDTYQIDPVGPDGQVPWYNVSSAPQTGTDCTTGGVPDGVSCTHVIRGGCYNYMEPQQATSYRQTLTPFMGTDHIATVRPVLNSV